MFRELHEEVGLRPNQVRVIARTRDWLRYEVPDRYIRRDARGHYKGQKQIWYLLQLLGHDWDLNLRATNHPEFDAWRWNDYWVPLDVVVEFKRGVYEMALTELARFLLATNSATATCAAACARVSQRAAARPPCTARVRCSSSPAWNCLRAPASTPIRRAACPPRSRKRLPSLTNRLLA